jgi:hypothetical protein
MHETNKSPIEVLGLVAVGIANPDPTLSGRRAGCAPHRPTQLGEVPAVCTVDCIQLLPTSPIRAAGTKLRSSRHPPDATERDNVSDPVPMALQDTQGCP